MRTLTTAWHWLLVFSLFFTGMTTARPRTLKSDRRAVEESSLLTNAARFQAGLGPMKPKSLFSPTRASAARASSSPSSRPSAKPALALTRNIEVRSTDSDFLGFVSTDVQGKGFIVAANPQEKLVIKAPQHTTSSFNLLIMNSEMRGSFLGLDNGVFSPPEFSQRNYLVRMSEDISSSSAFLWKSIKSTNEFIATRSDSSSNTHFWLYRDSSLVNAVNSTSSNSSLGREVSITVDKRASLNNIWIKMEILYIISEFFTRTTHNDAILVT